MSVTRFIEWCEAILHDLAAVGSTAQKTRNRAMRSPRNALAYGTGADFVDGNGPVRNLVQRQRTLYEEHSALVEEPFIMRFEVFHGTRAPNESGERKHIYYLCRTPPVGLRLEGATLVSSASSVGVALRSAQEGEGIELPEVRPPWDAESDCVVYKADVAPVRLEGVGELSYDADVSTPSHFSTSSVREWLARVAQDANASVSGTALNTSSRRKRFQLYDQKSLNQPQRELLMSSFNSRLLLIGPAGTGKTTALVKRIVDITILSEASSGDYDFDDLDERRQDLEIPRADDYEFPINKWAFIVPHERWVTYTKDAFHQEYGLPFAEGRIKTASEIKADIADALKLAPLTHPDALSDFSFAQQEEAMRAITHAIDTEFLRSLNSALKDLDGPARRHLGAWTHDLSSPTSLKQGYYKSLHLRKYLEPLNPRNQADSALSRMARKVKKYTDAPHYTKDEIREFCEEIARGEADSENPVLHALNEVGYSTDDVLSIGALFILRRAVQTIIQAPRKWLVSHQTIPERVEKKLGAIPDEFVRDFQSFIMMRNARIAWKSISQSAIPMDSVIDKRISKTYGHLYVDEFENRSLLELALLASLVHPRSDAITFSGDAAQDTSQSGADAEGRLRLALELADAPEMRAIAFDKLLRQTSRLSAVAHLIRYHEPSAMRINDSDPKLLVEVRLARRALPNWLRQRCWEIQDASSNKVTTAILTPTSRDRDRLFDILASDAGALPLPLTKLNSDTEKEQVGTDPSIFIASLDNAEAISGLEFEGVLIIDADRILQSKNGRNKLYVSVTRGARYLGMTFAREVPESLEGLFSYTEGASWS